MAKRQFGVSTRLYQSRRLTRDHLLHIAAHGFEVVEVVSAAGHFDPSHAAAVADLQQWLAEARLGLDAVAAPVPDGLPAWDAAVENALFVARRIPMRVLIVPVGAPKSASKLVERLAPLAEALGLTIAVDSRSPSMSPVGSLVNFVERCDAQVGIALDFAAAATGSGPGGLVDAIEMVSEHLVAARVPAETAIDWAAVMTTVQKVGYEGPFIIDVGAAGLNKARQTREKMERWLTSI